MMSKVSGGYPLRLDRTGEMFQEDRGVLEYPAGPITQGTDNQNAERVGVTPSTDQTPDDGVERPLVNSPDARRTLGLPGELYQAADMASEDPVVLLRRGLILERSA